MAILRRLRTLLYMFALLGVALSTILLHLPGFNPTGRRLSSQLPEQTGPSMSIGQSGEDQLARDLRLPNNNRADQLICLCRSAETPLRGECNTCRAVPDMQSTFRRPDFVGGNYIAESKNAANLHYSGREVDQIGDYVRAARHFGQPLWVYVRVDTQVAPEFEQLVASTGGRVVYYFRTPGYTDPIEQIGQTGLGISLAVLGLLVFTWLPRHRRRTRVKTPVVAALHAAKTAEAYYQRRAARLRSDLRTPPPSNTER